MTIVAAPSADLTDEEIERITRPLRQGAARVRYLQSLGLTVKRRPDGQPVVARSNYDAVMGQPGPSTDGIVWGVH